MQQKATIRTARLALGAFAWDAIIPPKMFCRSSGQTRAEGKRKLLIRKDWRAAKKVSALPVTSF